MTTRRASLEVRIQALEARRPHPLARLDETLRNARIAVLLGKAFPRAPEDVQAGVRDHPVFSAAEQARARRIYELFELAKQRRAAHIASSIA